MREIKFIWVCRNKHFNEIHRVELTDTMLLEGKYPSWIATDNCEIIAKIIPMGIKDKNKKEIYEGDRVRVDNRIYEVLFCNASFKFMEMKSMLEGAIDFFPACLLSHCYCNKNVENFEVIGNIYENPELKLG